MEGGALPIRLFEFLVVFITVKALDSKGRKMFNTNSIFLIDYLFVRQFVLLSGGSTDI